MRTSNKRQLTNLLLLIGVTALVYVAWHDHQLREGTPQQVATLVPYALDEITEFSVERPNTARITVRKVGANWAMVSPIEHPARPERVRALLQLLKQPREIAYPIHRADLSKLGLRPPQAELVIYDQSLRFGEREPSSGLRYLRVVDDIILVDDYFFQLLSSGVNAFAELDIVGDDHDNTVSQVTLNGTPVDFDAVAWTYAKAAAIQPVPANTDAKALIGVFRQDGQQQQFALRHYPQNNSFGLQPQNQAFEYLIDQSLAELLSLSE